MDARLQVCVGTCVSVCVCTYARHFSVFPVSKFPSFIFSGHQDSKSLLVTYK